MPPKIKVMKYTLVIADSQDQESFDRGLPYEKFLLGKQNASAPLELQSHGVTVDPNICIARIEPIHIHAARDHLVLTSTQILDIKASEADDLFESVKDIFAEMSSITHRSKPHKWFIESSALQTLSTVSTSQAEGRNIDHWMPSDTSQEGVARQWRKWQNEIQMIWFNHPVNEARQAEGMLSINSVWISGNGTLTDIKPNERLLDAKQWHSSDGCLNLLASHLNKPHTTSLNELSLANTISLLSASDPELSTVWQKANEALINHEIKAIELIDFPEGQERSRTITIEQLPKKGFALWKKPVVGSLQDMLRS
ncbi:hypothetical protein [Polynucleobacter sp. MWH-CaK5]|uniref:hypothetical protein n=1 Tax=Polynucleobacter sp. MWH-CaK5 TaxID=2689107 RepID=UPI001BFD91C6|nr:hypothetical protein [Polynucleobacter sp. MWH-CaK5]